jgi:hypothetical protein
MSDYCSELTLSGPDVALTLAGEKEADRSVVLIVSHDPPVTTDQRVGAAAPPVT